MLYKPTDAFTIKDCLHVFPSTVFILLEIYLDSIRVFGTRFHALVKVN